jgi:2-polyprenyl-6-hydroxyphenyl methylase / 3-demethylubiquinone-9 3-methyltransferase
LNEHAAVELSIANDRRAGRVIEVDSGGLLSVVVGGGRSIASLQPSRATRLSGGPVAIDNDVYDRVGQTWWDDDNPLVLLHGSMTRARMQYFRGVVARVGLLPGGRVRRRLLDIGSGGGFLAEEFCRLGFAVTGVDLSEVSVRTAHAHAAAGGLDIDYRTGAGEQLPVEDAAFDVACCSDVLEHVDDVDRVLAETARALKPGGLYLFDTLNRTWSSKLATNVTQQWRPTRVIDFPAHDWSMFLTPAELTDRMRRQHLMIQEAVGLGPRANPGTLAASLVRLRRGHLTYRQASDRVDMGRTRSTRLFYMGYALKH